MNDRDMAREGSVIKILGSKSAEFADIAESESLSKRFGIELNGIEYDAKFIFEYWVLSWNHQRWEKIWISPVVEFSGSKAKTNGCLLSNGVDF